MKIFLTVMALAAISVTGHFVIFKPVLNDILHKQEVQQVFSAARTIAQNLDMEANLAIKSLASVTRLAGFNILDQVQIENSLITFDATDPFFIYTWAMDANGRVIAAPSRPDRLVEDRSDRDYFSQPTPTYPTHFQKVRISTRGRFSLVVGTVILNENGEKIGVLAGSLGLMDRNPQMYQSILEAPFPEQYQVSLFSANNILLAHSDRKLPQPSLANLKSLSKQPFMEYMAAGNRESQSISIQGQKHILGFATVPSTGWTVFVQVPDSFVTQNVSKITKRLSTLLGILLLILFSVILLAAESFSRSLSGLTLALKNFGQQGKAELPTVQGRGEISDAITAFNEMVAGRQMVESQLQESEVRFRTLIDQAADAFYLHDQKGRLLNVNQQACDSLGYSREELLSMSVTEIDALSLTEDYETGIWKTIRPDTPVTVEGVHLRKDGTTFPVEVRIGMLITDKEKCILALARDISSRKKFEEEHRQAQKMEAIGTLAGGIAHDFNNILTAIFGNVGLAMMNLSKPAELTEYLESIEKSAIRAKDLVAQILTFSRKAEMDNHQVRVDTILKEALKLLRPSIPSTIEIKEDILSQDTVVADPTQLHQIIMNLCTNAYHAMRDTGGTMSIALKTIEITSEDSAERENMRPGRYLQLEVNDTGHGMSRETKEKIFEPYFTTKGVGDGTGLGLAVVHGIIKDHNGYITVVSDPGKGTSFHVYLPASEKETDTFDATLKPEPLPGGSEQLMYVDDEENNTKVIKEMLTKYGYQVDIFTNGSQAWQEFKKDMDKYDLIISDMTMPQMTGMELAENIMGVRPNLPVILCTGYSDRIDREKSLAMGISEYLQKPMSMSKLLKTVRQTLDNV